VAALDEELAALHKANPVSQLLAEIPGVGPLGAITLALTVEPGSKSASAWLLQLLERKPRKLAAVALANKMARIIWTMMSRGEAYRRQPIAA